MSLLGAKIEEAKGQAMTDQAAPIPETPPTDDELRHSRDMAALTASERDFMLGLGMLLRKSGNRQDADTLLDITTRLTGAKP